MYFRFFKHVYKDPFQVSIFAFKYHRKPVRANFYKNSLSVFARNPLFCLANSHCEPFLSFSFFTRYEASGSLQRDAGLYLFFQRGKKGRKKNCVYTQFTLGAENSQRFSKDLEFFFSSSSFLFAPTSTVT